MPPRPLPPLLTQCLYLLQVVGGYWLLSTFSLALLLPAGPLQAALCLATWAACQATLTILSARYGVDAEEHAPQPLTWPMLARAVQQQPLQLGPLLVALAALLVIGLGRSRLAGAGAAHQAGRRPDERGSASGISSRPAGPVTTSCSVRTTRTATRKAVLAALNAGVAPAVGRALGGVGRAIGALPYLSTSLHASLHAKFYVDAAGSSNEPLLLAAQARALVSRAFDELHLQRQQPQQQHARSALAFPFVAFPGCLHAALQVVLPDGNTEEPAAELAEALLPLLPPGMSLQGLALKTLEQQATSAGGMWCDPVALPARSANPGDVTTPLRVMLPAGLVAALEAGGCGLRVVAATPQVAAPLADATLRAGDSGWPDDSAECDGERGCHDAAAACAALAAAAAASGRTCARRRSSCGAGGAPR